VSVVGEFGIWVYGFTSLEQLPLKLGYDQAVIKRQTQHEDEQSNN
jgi:hypothetical protein